MNAPVDAPEISRNTTYDKAIAFRNNKIIDSAFYYFNKSKEVFLQEKDSLGAGKCLVNMAIISTNQGDYFGGQELSLNAASFFEPQNRDHHVYIKSNLNNLGIATYSLKKYKQAIDFYKESLKYTADSSDVLVIKNNIANAYRSENNYEAAISLYQEILKVEKDSSNFSRVISNFAFTKWLNKSTYNPVEEFNRALSIRKKQNDLIGQNSSYAQLSEYYFRKKPDSALFYANKMYQTASRLQFPDDRLEALQKLVQLSKPEKTQHYFSIYTQLQDSLQTARSGAKNQFALIRYETEKHKADKLKLQKENAIRNIFIGGLTLVMIAASICTVLYNQRKKKEEKLKTQNLIKESELKTSKKVHDVVANGLYKLMSEMENGEQLNQNKLLDQMEALYEQSRDISYESKSAININFDEEIKQLLSAFATPNIKVLIFGNNDSVWDKINENSKYELKHILQELMVNMKKHSKASYVAIRFEKLPNEVKIYYSDNGVGMPKSAVFGNGLKNTGNRIKAIDGNINFGVGEDGGLKIQLSFPTI
ncbi:tetratricopeptide repeat protein [Pedobacter alpinus]|uniref:histidine kinase n=1 Tax=Pedobacter alpinus TaxID=1590643 RepID=A0ABW5TXT6_9SPHI